jgi:uncharacterized protein YbjT (DUF2867 family)
MAARVLIAGSSGMVGSIILRESLASEQVGQVTSLVRRFSGIQHPKLKEVILPDFTELTAIAENLKEIDVAFFCIGVYTGAVPDDEFKKITVDQANAFGDSLKAQSPHARLCFLSGQGADRSEKSRMSFARYKGMAENHLLSLELGGLHIFRPGYIYPVKKRKEPNFTYRMMRTLYPLLGSLVSNVTSEELGSSMFKVGMEGRQEIVLENQTIKDVLEG